MWFSPGSVQPYHQQHWWIIQSLASASATDCWSAFPVPQTHSSFTWAMHLAFPFWAAPFLDPFLCPATALGPQCHDVVPWLHSGCTTVLCLSLSCWDRCIPQSTASSSVWAVCNPFWCLLGMEQALHSSLVCSPTTTPLADVQTCSIFRLDPHFKFVFVYLFCFLNFQKFFLGPWTIPMLEPCELVRAQKFLVDVCRK